MSWGSLSVLSVGVWARAADQAFLGLPPLPEAEVPSALPSLSIVVPARNEEANLARLLPSLAGLRYPGPIETILVDDGSTDGTAARAREAGVRVLTAGPRPPGWLGKPHACQQGALAAAGDWLLFTDADTVHEPDGPARAVAHALAEELDGLSLFLRQDNASALDRLALMAAFAGLFAGRPDPRRLLNGQYVLLRREAYERCGGFAAVRQEMMEDLALGRRLAELGLRVPMMRGDDAASVRMYPDASSLWLGMCRLGSGSLRFSGPRALLSALFVTAAAWPAVLLPLALLRRRSALRTALLWGAVSLGFLPWARRFGGARWALLAPFGALFVQAAGSWGLLRRALGRGVIWKKRRV